MRTSRRSMRLPFDLRRQSFETPRILRFPGKLE